MSAQTLEVSSLGVGTVLRLERDAWSMVKWLRQATNKYAPPPPPPPPPPSFPSPRPAPCYRGCMFFLSQSGFWRGWFQGFVSTAATAPAYPRGQGETWGVCDNIVFFLSEQGGKAWAWEHALLVWGARFAWVSRLFSRTFSWAQWKTPRFFSGRRPVLIESTLAGSCFCRSPPVLYTCFSACLTPLLLCYKIILITPAVSSTNFGSILVSASWVIHRSSVFGKFSWVKT